MKKTIQHSILGVVLFTLFMPLLIGQNTVSQKTLQIADDIMNKSMKAFNVAGASIGIVKDGEIIHVKGYGVKSITSNRPVNRHTNFAIASNSKAFTTTALALLVEDGKLSWEDKVKDHIPEFKMYNAYVTENFNIQDLLTHRSGLGLGVGDLMFFPDGADFTIEDLLGSFQYFEPVSALRTKFDYDNLLYIVAGELIKRISGITWEAFIQQRIFDPLQMDNSFAAITTIKDKSNLASPHSSESGKLIELPHFEEMINGAAGGIQANVDDLCNWMLVHLNEGRYGTELEKNLFANKSQREMWKIHTVLDANPAPRYNSHFAGYGLGWGLTDMKGNMVVTHTGGLPGMLSKTILVPDLELGIVILTNTSDDGGALFSAVGNTLLDHYWDLEDFEWVDKYKKRLASRMEQGDAVTASVWKIVENADDSIINQANFLGVYEDNWFGKVEIFNKDGQLWIKSHRSPKLIGSMHFYKANTFAIKWNYRDMNCDAFAMFGLDEEGKAQSLKMKGISPNIDFSFDFHDLDLKRVIAK